MKKRRTVEKAQIVMWVRLNFRKFITVRTAHTIVNKINVPQKALSLAPLISF